jgi:transmembrane sensor
LAGIIIGFWWIAGINRSELPAQTAHQETKATIDDELIKFSDRQVVRLPDGSTVLLNKGSELSYDPDQFGTKNREVNLIGEGFFDISHDPSRPFLVHTGKITTTVLGTAFNINSFLHKNEVRVTVTRGKVQVGDEKTTYAMITPDQEIIVNTATNAFVKQTVKTEVVTEWKDKFLIMDNVTMSEAVDLIGGRFNVRLVFANEDLKKCRVSASFLNDEDLDHVLKVIGTVNQITFTNKPNGEIALSGEASCQ